MNKPNPILLLPLLAALLLGACQSNPLRSTPDAVVSEAPRAWFDGEYDNHEQVARADATQVPRVHFEVTPIWAQKT